MRVRHVFVVLAPHMWRGSKGGSCRAVSKLQNNIRFSCYTPTERQQVLAPISASAEPACHLLRVCWLALLDQRQGYFATREHTWYIACVITALLRTYTAKADLCAVVSRWLCGRAGWLSTSLWLFDTSAVHQAGGGEEAEGVAARKEKVRTAGRKEPQGPGGGHLACTSVAWGLTLCGVELCLIVGIL